jgi:hypothetical protein
MSHYSVSPYLVNLLGKFLDPIAKKCGPHGDQKCAVKASADHRTIWVVFLENLAVQFTSVELGIDANYVSEVYPKLAARMSKKTGGSKVGPAVGGVANHLLVILNGWTDLTGTGYVTDSTVATDFLLIRMPRLLDSLAIYAKWRRDSVLADTVQGVRARWSEVFHVK